jgi:hypothetical protein
MCANEHKLITDCFHRPSDILVQARMARLVDRCLVLLASHEKISRVNLPNIQDCMNCHFDCTWVWDCNRNVMIVLDAY